MGVGLFHLLLLGQGNEEVPLPGCEQLLVLQEVRLVEGEQSAATQGGVGHGDVRKVESKEVMADTLCVVGVAACPLQDEVDNFVVYLAVAVVERFADVVGIVFCGYGIQSHKLGAGEERPLRIAEDVGHHVLFAAAEDEAYVVEPLYVGAEQCLNVVFLIIAYLLELVNGKEYGFVLLL